MKGNSKSFPVLLEPFTWLGIAVAIGTGAAQKLGGEIAEPIINDVLGKEEINYQALFRQAIDEIVANVQIIIGDALNEEFIQQYISKCSFLRSQLVLYSQTKDESLIRDLQIMSGEVAQQLYDKGINAFGGLLTATSLHLLSLRALAEKHPEWQQGLDDHFKKYATWLEEVGTLYWEHMDKKVSESCVCKPIIFLDNDGDLDCDDVPPEQKRYTFIHSFNVESIEFGTYAECENARFQTSEEQEKPSLELYAHSKALIHYYREFKIAENH
ncbi:hypothetical protein ACU3L3_14315 [Priestia endophytica]